MKQTVKITDRANNPTFEFNGKQEQVFGRWYFSDNNLWMPSVTTTLNPVVGYSPKEGEGFADVAETLAKQKYKKDASKKPQDKEKKLLSEYRDLAASKGTLVHSLTEKIDNGEQLNLDNIASNVKAEIDAYIRYYEDNKKHRNVKGSELFVFSERYGFAGQLDTLVFDEIEEKYRIEDKKTGKKKVTHGWQLAAYGIASSEGKFLPVNEADAAYEAQYLRNGRFNPQRYAHYDWIVYRAVAMLDVWKGLNWNWGLFKLHESGKYKWLFQLAAVDYVNRNPRLFERYAYERSAA